MARPERKNVDYFPHPVKHGKKMFLIEKKYGNNGYAVWFKILEQLGDADNHYLDYKNEEQYLYLHSICNIDEKLLINILDDIAKIGGIDRQLWSEGRVIYSHQLVESVSDAYKKRNNKLLPFEGLLLHLQGLGVLKQGFRVLNTPDNTQRIEKDSKEKKSKGKCLFKNSPVFDKNKFKEALPNWNNQKLKYYWNAANDYSESKGAMYIDWIAAVKNWDRRNPDEWLGKKFNKWIPDASHEAKISERQIEKTKEYLKNLKNDEVGTAEDYKNVGNVIKDLTLAMGRE